MCVCVRARAPRVSVCLPLLVNDICTVNDENVNVSVCACVRARSHECWCVCVSWHFRLLWNLSQNYPDNRMRIASVSTSVCPCSPAAIPKPKPSVELDEARQLTMRVYESLGYVEETDTQHHNTGGWNRNDHRVDEAAHFAPRFSPPPPRQPPFSLPLSPSLISSLFFGRRE